MTLCLHEFFFQSSDERMLSAPAPHAGDAVKTLVTHSPGDLHTRYSPTSSPDGVGMVAACSTHHGIQTSPHDYATHAPTCGAQSVTYERTSKSDEFGTPVTSCTSDPFDGATSPLMFVVQPPVTSSPAAQASRWHCLSTPPTAPVQLRGRPSG